MPLFQNPSGIVNRDFTIFATAVKVAEEAGYPAVFDIALQKQAQEEIVGDKISIGGGLLPFNHPPILLPLMQVLINPGNLPRSFLLWTAVNLILVGTCLAITGRWLAQKGIPYQQQFVLWLPLILLYPLHQALFQGQDVLVPMLGLVIWAIGTNHNRYGVAGVGLSLTVLMPQIALALAIPLFWGQRKVFYSFIVSAGAMAFISIGMIRIPGTLDFINMIIETAGASGDTFGVNKQVMLNASGIFLRLWPSAPETILSLVTWGVYLGGIGYLCWLHHAYKDDDPEAHLIVIGISIVVAMFASPHLHVHSMSVLWVPLAVFYWGWHHYEHRSLVGGGLLALTGSAVMFLLNLPSFGLNWLPTIAVLAGLLFSFYRWLHLSKSD